MPTGRPGKTFPKRVIGRDKDVLLTTQERPEIGREIPETFTREHAMNFYVVVLGVQSEQQS
jgi:hypothetical protein